MSRHLAPVPPQRRIVGVTLAAGTIILLGSMIAIISESPEAAGADGPISASADTTNTEARPVADGPSDSPVTTARQVTLVPDPAPGTSPTTAPATTASTPDTGSATSEPDSTPETSATTETSIDSADTASTTVATTTTTVPPIVLGPDGVGVTELGAGYDEAMENLTVSLGPPESDSGWISSISDVGTCPGEIVRIVRWAGLRTFFSDGPTEYGSEERHFFFFSQSGVDAEEPADLTTSEGIGLGSTVAELETTYGSDVAVASDLRFGPQFTIDPSGPGFMSGTLTGTGDDDIVTSISGGFGCGA